MLHVLGCITGQHDLRLVALAGVLCLLSCLTSTSMILRGRAVEGSARRLWLAGAGAVFGCGIWATHFIGMLAYQPGLPMAYDTDLTMASIVVAVGISGWGFVVALNRSRLLGGALAGLAVSAMHYLGMAAVRIPAYAAWDIRYVVASVLVGVVLCALGLRVVLGRADLRALVTGSGVLAGAIVAMHFTGMSAVTFWPDPGVVIPHVFLNPGALAVALAAIGILIVALGLTGAIVDYHLARRATGEAERLRSHIVELEQTKRDLQATSNDLSRALAAASEANEIKARFLASMSHELRTPLNAIIGFADFLLMEAFGPIGNPRYREYVHDIRESGTLLLSLINDILDLSRLDAGEMALTEETLDITDLIAEALRMVRPQAQQAGIVLANAADTALPLLRADRRRVLQVLLNLLSNAIKFTPASGSVKVEARFDGAELAVAVADTGIGIAPEDIPRALERFGQVDSRLSRKYQGAGLGLPLARQLMALHGGHLRLESVLDRGTTVTVTFPATRILAKSEREVA